MKDDEKAVAVAHGDDWARAWGCPAAGHDPDATILPPDFARIAVGASTTMGIECTGTCPFAVIERAEPWVIEITQAASAMGEHFVPEAFEAVLGRTPTAADVTAWLAWKRAGAAAWASDRRDEEANRPKPPSQK